MNFKASKRIVNHYHDIGLISSSERTKLIGPDHSVKKFSNDNDLKLNENDTKRQSSTKYNKFVRDNKNNPGLVARAIQTKTQHDMKLNANVNRVGGSIKPNRPQVNRGRGRGL